MTDRLVVDQIKCIGRDLAVVHETLSQTRRQAEEQSDRREAERTDLRAQFRDNYAEHSRLAVPDPGDPYLIDIHDRIRNGERRVTEIDNELAALDGRLVDETEVASVLADFDAVWDCLTPREQAHAGIVD